MVAGPMVWGHDGCDALYRVKLTACPRHPGAALEEKPMPKITRFGGHTNAGLTETDAGFADDTVRTQARADELAGGPTAANDVPPADPDAVERQRLDDAAADNTDDVVDPPFNPSELNVADVNELLAGLDGPEREAVLKAERADKNRKGIVGDDQDNDAVDPPVSED